MGSLALSAGVAAGAISCPAFQLLNFSSLHQGRVNPTSTTELRRGERASSKSRASLASNSYASSFSLSVSLSHTHICSGALSGKREVARHRVRLSGIARYDALIRRPLAAVLPLTADSSNSAQSAPAASSHHHLLQQLFFCVIFTFLSPSERLLLDLSSVAIAHSTCSLSTAEQFPARQPDTQTQPSQASLHRHSHAAPEYDCETISHIAYLSL